MRFAGELFQPQPIQDTVSSLANVQKPAEGFNPSINATGAHNRPPGAPAVRRDQFPGNRVGASTRLQALSPLLLPGHFIKEAVKGAPTAPGTLHEGPDPFQQNNKIRPSDSDNQFMDIMRSGFV